MSRPKNKKVLIHRIPSKLKCISKEIGHTAGDSGKALVTTSLRLMLLIISRSQLERSALVEMGFFSFQEAKLSTQLNLDWENTEVAEFSPEVSKIPALI